MSAEVKKSARLEPQPLHPVEMPEYRYQDYVVIEHTLSQARGRDEKSKKSIDLSGVSLNLS
jgi:hypothetical protein